MTEGLSNDEVEAAALMWGAAAAANYAAARFPQIEGFAWRFLAARMSEVLYPFVKMAAYATLADELRTAGLDEVAAQIEAAAREVLNEEQTP